jgi:hypothetical protein
MLRGEGQYEVRRCWCRSGPGGGVGNGFFLGTLFGFGVKRGEKMRKNVRDAKENRPAAAKVEMISRAGKGTCWSFYIL